MWARTAFRDPSYPRANSLRRAVPGRHIVVFGGSQMGGGNPTGGFGSLDLTAFGAPNNAIPSGVVLIRDGVTLSAYPAVHGIEPGLIEGARRGGWTSGLKVLMRIVDSTGADDWLTTHFATVVADVTAAGMTPNLVIYATGGQDALSAATVGAARAKLRQLRNKAKAAWPGSAWLCNGLMSTDLTSFPQQPALRQTAIDLFSQPLDDTEGYVAPDDFVSDLQTDNTHLKSAGDVRLGLRNWELGRNGGALLAA